MGWERFIFLIKNSELKGWYKGSTSGVVRDIINNQITGVVELQQKSGLTENCKILGLVGVVK